MPISRNPETGEMVSLGADGQWTPVQRATNPETGAKLVYDGSAWIAEPPPDRSTLERVGRGIVMPAAGFNESVATTAGALPDMVGAGMRAVGLPSSKPGQYTDWARQGMQFLTGKPPEPETTTERLLHGAGRGVGDAASVLIPATAVAQGARAGSVTQQLAQALAAQPATQLASGAAGGGVGEATGSPMLGLAASLATPLAMSGATRLAQPIRPNQPPETQRLIQVAEQEGIPLTAGQKTGSRVLRNMEAVFDQLPFTGAPQEAIHQGQREAFNRASLARSGTKANVATPEVLKEARARIGGEIGEIANRNLLQVTPDLLDKMKDIQSTLKYMPSEQAGPLSARLGQIEGMMIVPPHGGPNITIPGQSYAMMDSELGTAIKNSDGYLRDALGTLRSTLRSAMDDSISPADQAAWQQARRQYANLMTTARATGGAGAQTALGNVSPLGLRSALDQSTGRGYVFGQGDQNDLARVGQAFLRPPPDSGTAGRTGMQNLLTGAQFAGPGAVAGASTGSPLAAILAGGASLAGPRAVQAIYNTPAAQTYLTQGIPGMAGLVSNAPQINSPLVAALLGAHAKEVLPGPRR